MKFGIRKLESWGYQKVKNHDENSVLTQYRLVTDRRTDGQTDRQTRCCRKDPR